MVNHFLLNDEELIERLIRVIEDSVIIETNDKDEYIDHRHSYFNNSEYSQIKKEILERIMKK